MTFIPSTFRTFKLPVYSAFFPQTIMQFPFKSPSQVLDYTLDVTDLMAAEGNDLITAVVCSIIGLDSSLVIMRQPNPGTTLLTLILSGGTVNTNYIVRYLFTTNSSPIRIYSYDILLDVQNISSRVTVPIFIGVGPIGPVGPVGGVGPIGLVGPVGGVGPIGLVGPVGGVGPIGLVGPVGGVGPIGLVGPVGPIGYNTIGTLAASGSTQGTAALVMFNATILISCTNIANGVMLNAAFPISEIRHRDGSGVISMIYPPFNEQIEFAAGINTPASLSFGGNAVFIRDTSTTPITWRL